MRSVCVISDLHLGGAYPVPREPGKRGFRLCTHADAVAQFISGLSQKLAGGEQIELVLNGDTVDFLAESDAPNSWSAFTVDPEPAVKKFTSIVERDPAVFKALGTFVESGGRLVLLLGNHDIELSLPRVREALRQAIGIRPHHDFEFLYDGEAYVVGDALIEHGNRYDLWNQVRYDSLRRIRSLQSRRQVLTKEDEFPPPVGSRMVVSVINPIKGQYAFIDLLKPETDVVLPMLLALEPGYRKLIATLALLYKEARNYGVVAGARPRIGDHIRSERKASDIRIGGNIASKGSSRPAVSEEEAALREALERVLGDKADAFLQDIDAQVNAQDPLKGLGGNISFSGQVERAFGLARLFFGGKSEAVQQRLPALLTAIRVIQDSDTFNVGKEAATEYLKAAEDLAKRGFRYIIFGHTHLPKQVSLGDGRVYFNSGTWADVLQFPTSILQAPTEAEALRALECFVADMRAGNFSKWTLFNPHYVWLELDSANKVTKAELRTFSDSAS